MSEKEILTYVQCPHCGSKKVAVTVGEKRCGFGMCKAILGGEFEGEICGTRINFTRGAVKRIYKKKGLDHE